MSNQLKKVIFKTISYLKKQHDNQAEELIIELQAALQNIPESKQKDTEGKEIKGFFKFTLTLFDSQERAIWTDYTYADDHDTALDELENKFEDEASPELIEQWSGIAQIDYPDEYEPINGW